MAGNYYHDPRPFYGLGPHNLMSMDELFYGRREPPPWYAHQMPHGRYDDYPRSRSMEPYRHPEQYIQREDQYREYRRPDMRDDVYIGYQQDQHGAHKGQPKNPNHGGNPNQGGNPNHNHHGENKGKNQQKHDQKHQHDSDKEDDEKSHKGGNHGNSNKSHNNHGSKSHSNDHGHGHQQSWSDNKGFHGGHGHGHGYGRHRRSSSLMQTVLKKLGLSNDSSSDSDSSDDDRRQNRKGAHGRGHSKGDHKAYTVRFDDQFYGHSNNQKKGGKSEKLGEDHVSHGKKGGGQPQGILKSHKNNHGDDDSSADEGHKNHGHGKGEKQHHGGAESGKKGGQGGTKQHARAQSMDFRVNLCCENCERKVKKALWRMDVDEVLCDQWNNRVSVTGNAKPESVLKKLKSVKKDTLLWHQHK